MTELARLTHNLEVVETNVKMFNQIMEDTDIPGTEDARGQCYNYFKKSEQVLEDRTLLDKLETSCKAMQQRITLLLSELDPGK